MHPSFVARGTTPHVPIWFVTPRHFAQVVATSSTQRARAFAEAAGFEPKPGRHLLLPGADGALSGVLFGLEAADEADKDPFLPGRAARPAAGRHLPLRQRAARCAARGARLRARRLPLHALPQGGGQGRAGSSCPTASTATISRASPRASALARDLINTPANDMGPAELEDAARALAKRHGASVRCDRRRRSARSRISR